MKRTIIILTASAKYRNYCVAGIDAFTGEWVRLVSNDEEIHRALTPADMLFAFGRQCTPFDTVEVEIEKAVPSRYQPENLLIKKGIPLKYLKKVPLSLVLDVHPPEKPQFLYNNHRAFLFENEFSLIKQSLILIEASDLVISRKSYSENRKKFKISFTYNNIHYNELSMTDPEYFRKTNGSSCEKAYLVVSLPETPYANNLYYKFVAKILPFPGCYWKTVEFP